MKKQRITTLYAMAGLLLLASCNDNKPLSAPVEEAVKVQTATAVSRMVPQAGTFTGTIEADVINNIAPQSPARIKKVHVEVGDQVRVGQTLVEMDNVNLNQTRLQMENDRTEFQRVDELYKVGGISRATWDARKMAMELSKSSYENLLENTVLTSPISGIVTKRNYDNGDMYTGALPIYVVEQTRPVKLMVNVSEMLYTRVKKGMEVDVQLDVYGDEVFSGVVTIIHPAIDPGTRTFPVEVQIKNNDNRIIPGMFARITFNYGTEQHVLIPDRAVIKQNGSADKFVYVCKDGVARYRKITLGQLIGEEYEVLSGLNEGEAVAITGLARLSNGAEITVVR